MFILLVVLVSQQATMLNQFQTYGSDSFDRDCTVNKQKVTEQTFFSTRWGHSAEDQEHENLEEEAHPCTKDKLTFCLGRWPMIW